MKDSGGKLDELSHLLRPNALISAVAVTDAQVGDKQSVEWWPETGSTAAAGLFRAAQQWN
jgi:hypothetical protein